MKVLLINGSPKVNGNTALALEEIMRTLAKNMTFLMKSIALGKEQYGLPGREATQRINFIR